MKLKTHPRSLKVRQVRGKTHVKNLNGIIGLAILGVIVLAAITAPWVSSIDPAVQDLANRLQPPGATNADGTVHLLGTDALGRDLLSSVLYGARVSLFVGFASVVLGLLTGLILGVVAGYLGGWVDTVIMRAVDVTIVLPFFLMALILRVGLGSGLGSIILALGLSGWATYARLVRGEVLTVRRQEFILASKVAGAPNWFIMLKRITPHVVPSLIVLASLQIGVVIVAEASLTFLGLGIPPDIPSWGTILSGGRAYITRAWWVTTMPGLAIVFTVLSLNLIGDWLRDKRDPYAK